MIITSTSTIEGRVIASYLGPVFHMEISIEDRVPGTQDPIDTAYVDNAMKKCVNNLVSKGEALFATHIINFKVDVDTNSFKEKSIIYLSVSGTAVTLAAEV